MTAPTRDLAAELAWLVDHPQFDERPASITEFLGSGYLEIESGVRKRLKSILVDIMGEEVNPYRIANVERAIFTGGIGIGKGTMASILLTYMAHWVLCLKDPQGFYELLPGSRIAFMQMSTSEQQAKDVIFGDIKARIQHSPWFQKYPYDTGFKNQLRFPKDIWILPGDSIETTFEGYNILGGIVDEADSHKQTKDKDYAEAGYDTIHARVTSRFGNRGFLCVIGQMKKARGFVAKKYEEFKADPNAYAVKLPIWESLGWEKFTNEKGERDSFWYDTKKKVIVPKAVTLLGNSRFLEIPTVYKRDFQNNPEKALRDHAGIPPNVGDPFISMTWKVEAAKDKWLERFDGYESPVTPEGRLEDWFVCRDPLKRVVHIDMALSQDSLGFVMGHVLEVRDIDGELKPYIVIDLIKRWTAASGGEIDLSEVRRFIYHLRDERKFKITKVTMDGYQSADMQQQLRKKRFRTDDVSVDKQKLPYYDLREALYEDRIEIPNYLVKLRPADTELVEIAFRELTELIDAGVKVDHPPDGSKDVADALAGVTFTLMGDRAFRRNVTSLSSYKELKKVSGDSTFVHPTLGKMDGWGGVPKMPEVPTSFPRWDRR